MAVRRRGRGTWMPGREHAACGTPPKGIFLASGESILTPATMLRVLGRRLSAYPGVLGLLYRERRDLFELAIVAPPPMTSPIRLLAATWQDELRLLCPSCALWFRVMPAPPGNAEAYSCILWRR